MIVTGALCWWNERPEDLDRCVRGLGAIANRVVALDGAYERYPTGTAHSPKDQLAAIREAAKTAGLECVIEQPNRLWAGQVEKRSHLLALASQGSDWIATVDADHIVSADRMAARRFLDRNPHVDVVSVPYWTPPHPDRVMEDSAVGEWHELQVKGIQIIPHLWRVLPEMQVERFHWWYSAVKGGHHIWLWGGDDTRPHAIIHEIPCAYQVKHLTMWRTSTQIRLSRAFLNDREEVVRKTGQEDNLPGLRTPNYKYKRVLG